MTVTEKTSKLLERLAWIFLYGGLLTFVMGIAVLRQEAASGWAMAVVGGVFAVAGIVLIWVRSRVRSKA